LEVAAEALGHLRDAAEEFPFIDTLEVLQHAASMVHDGARAQQRQSQQRQSQQRHKMIPVSKDYMWLHPHGPVHSSGRAVEQTLSEKGREMDEEEEEKQNPQQHESWRVLFVSFTRQQQQHKHPQQGRAAV
jgi:hypothetical protein